MNKVKKIIVSENVFSDIVEGMIEKATPDQINLSSFETKKSLHPKIWVYDKMNSKVRLRLMDIADDFVKTLSIDWVKPDDLVVMGSIANFNWSKFSDIDLHILMDFSKVFPGKDKKAMMEVLMDFFDSKKNAWNSEHEALKVYGFPVEIYVQDSKTFKPVSGCYSLESNKWIHSPEYKGSAVINPDEVKEIAASIITKADDLEEMFKNAGDNEYKLRKCNERIKRLLKSLKEMRSGAFDKKKGEGEMSTPNIVYKVIRRTGYLDKLYDLKNLSYDKLNSIR